MEKNLKKSIVYALLTAIISGISIFYSKISLTKIDPLILTTARNFWVGALFGGIGMFGGFRVFREIGKIEKKDKIILVLIGLIGGAMPFYLFFTGLKFTDAQTANFIHKTLFIWVLVLSVLFLKEKINLSYLIGFVLLFISNLFFAPGNLTLGKGEVMILTATLLWSIENILAKKILRNVSSNLVSLARMGIGSILLLGAVFLTGKSNLLFTLDPKQLSVIFIGGTILFFYVFTWYRALKYAPATLATMLLTFSVIVGNLLIGSFTQIKLTQGDIYSSLLILLATCLLLFKSQWTNKAY